MERIEPCHCGPAASPPDWRWCPKCHTDVPPEHFHDGETPSVPASVDAEQEPCGYTWGGAATHDGPHRCVIAHLRGVGGVHICACNSTQSRSDVEQDSIPDQLRGWKPIIAMLVREETNTARDRSEYAAERIIGYLSASLRSPGSATHVRLTREQAKDALPAFREQVDRIYALGYDLGGPGPEDAYGSQGDSA